MVLAMRSKITTAVLRFLMMHEDERFYINQLARQLGLDSGNLTRKLIELEASGILKSEVRGRERFFSINGAYPLIEEYRKIVGKTIGLAPTLKEALAGVDDIAEAYLYGSCAQNAMDATSDIDLLVVGTHDTISYERVMRVVAKNVGREIHTLHMHPDEFKTKQKRDPFLKSILAGALVKLI